MNRNRQSTRLTAYEFPPQRPSQVQHSLPNHPSAPAILCRSRLNHRLESSVELKLKPRQSPTTATPRRIHPAKLLLPRSSATIAQNPRKTTTNGFPHRPPLPPNDNRPQRRLPFSDSKTHSEKWPTTVAANVRRNARCWISRWPLRRNRENLCANRDRRSRRRKSRVRRACAVCPWATRTAIRRQQKRQM